MDTGIHVARMPIALLMMSSYVWHHHNRGQHCAERAYSIPSLYKACVRLDSPSSANQGHPVVTSNLATAIHKQDTHLLAVAEAKELEVGRFAGQRAPSKFKKA